MEECFVRIVVYLVRNIPRAGGRFSRALLKGHRHSDSSVTIRCRRPEFMFEIKAENMYWSMVESTDTPRDFTCVLCNNSFVHRVNELRKYADKKTNQVRLPQMPLDSVSRF